MDRDPELDVTLSDGRQVATFQIAAVAGVREAWAIVEPRMPPRVIRGCADALATRERLDARIAARLAAGWVPVDRRWASPPSVSPTPLPPDLVLLISSLLEALTRARPALRAADPSGQLWATCHVFRQQAGRFGVGAPHARLLRARQERRLGALAEQAGDLPAAILHYRAALASHARVGVKRRLRQLALPGPAAPLPGHWGRREAGAGVSVTVGSPPHRRRAGTPIRLDLWRPESGHVGGRRHPATPVPGEDEMKGRVQIVGRLPVELNRRVRAAAKRRKVSLNSFLIDALTQALGPRRVAEKETR